MYRDGAMRDQAQITKLLNERNSFENLNTILSKRIDGYLEENKALRMKKDELYEATVIFSKKLNMIKEIVDAV